MEVPKAKEYLAILVDSNGRVLLRTKPGLVGGFFIRVEPPADKSPESAIIDSVFYESGFEVRVESVGDDVYFGARGMCGYFFVKLVGSEEDVRSDDFSVAWYGIEDAAGLISGLKNDSEFELEMAVLAEVSSIVKRSGAADSDRFKGLIGTSEFESFKVVCIDVERILSGGIGGFLRGGAISGLVLEVLDETQKRIDRGEINSEYEHNSISLADRNSRSKKHECCLVEAISISLTKAYGLLLVSDYVGYKEAHLNAVKYIKEYDLLYPEERRTRRERGFKGGKGKGKASAEVSRRVGRSEELIYQAILAALCAHVPYRSRVNSISIVDMIIDEVFCSVQCQGVECNRDDLRGCILNMLVDDVEAKKIIESR